MSQALMYANQAVFSLQMRSTDAIRYISKNAGVDLARAEQAFKSVIIFHKKK
jgi:hypothetical protein